MRILICDDHALFREGLELVLARLDPAARLESVADAESALARVAADPNLDLVLLDMALPGLSGLELVRLRRDHPTVPVVILSASESPADARAALERGASGFIPKSSRGGVLLGAVQLVLGGGVYVPPLLLDAPLPAPSRDADSRHGLTPRQLEVLRLSARGLTNAEIARVLGISGATVKNHLERIYDVLDASNRTEAAMRLHELGLDDEGD